MALDGAFLYKLKEELSVLIGAKVDKVHQPFRDQLMLQMRDRNGMSKLLLCVKADAARLHVTQQSFENPSAPPMLCMLLRKLMTGARLKALRQQGLERALFLDFDTYNELGDPISLTLAVEIMGRHSNIILIGQDGKIIDAVKRIDESMSEARQVLPGLFYQPVPPQEKLYPLTCQPSEVLAKLAEMDEPVDKALLRVLQGLSPIVCREVCWQAFGSRHVTSGNLTDEDKTRLTDQLSALFDTISNQSVMPCGIYKAESAVDFAFMPITQYSDSADVRQYKTLSELLDDFYYEKEHRDRQKQKSSDLFRVVTSLSERTIRRLTNQKKELADYENGERCRLFGDIINANLYLMHKGDTLLEAQNYYSETAEILQIPLIAKLNPSQNAQHYYKEYRKSRTAKTILTEQIRSGEEELTYFDSVLYALNQTNTDTDIQSIRTELGEQGYLKRERQPQGKSGKPVKKKDDENFLHFLSSDGLEILVGRNNRQNDLLTFKKAMGRDIWFHARNIPGSHTLVISQGVQPPDTTLTEAAQLAAWFSKARGSAQIPVDYTEARRVKKPQGAKPGFVNYFEFKTAFVSPDEEMIKKFGENKA